MRYVALALLALALAGCKEHTAAAPQAVLDAAATPAATGNPPALELPATATPPKPNLADLTAAMSNGTAFTPVGDASLPRFDVSSADAFVASLKAMEPTLPPTEAEQLRAALTVFTLQAETKIQFIAQSLPAQNPPQFSDQQLLQITFGQIDGMTAPQAIALARRIGKDLPPVQLPSGQPAPPAIP